MAKQIITTLEARKLLKTNKKIESDSKGTVRLDFQKNGYKQEFNLVSTEDIGIKHFILDPLVELNKVETEPRKGRGCI